MRRKAYIQPQTKQVPLKHKLLAGSQKRALRFEDPDDEDYWLDPKDAD